MSSLAVNLFFLRMDDHFYRKARNSKSRYGRLTDDFVMSGDCRDTALAFGAELDHAISNRNLRINEKKREEKGFLDGHQLKDLHSLIVNSRRGIRPKDAHIKKALGLAQHYARRAKLAKPEELPYLADLRQRSYGMMYYCRQADFSPATHLKRVLSHADRKVLRMLHLKGLYPHKNKWWVVCKSRNEPQRLVALWEKQQRVTYCA